MCAFFNGFRVVLCAQPMRLWRIRLAGCAMAYAIRAAFEMGIGGWRGLRDIGIIGGRHTTDMRFLMAFR